MPESSGNELVLVLGAARSGKSSWALSYTEERYDFCLFLATAEVLDEEMAERVRLHQESRGPKWKLLEEPLEVADVLETRCGNADAVLIDCLTIWLSNIMLKKGDGQVKYYQDRLLTAFSNRKRATIVVANEVGAGIVPEHALGRRYRDLAGFLNQEIAAIADKVIYTIAGLPMCLKGRIE